ncbi:MAG TPA: PKD domain-containing protein [Planctomycetota bacterium]|nr:PKD domain-containing protein [Planctomycetota bacterium]
MKPAAWAVMFCCILSASVFAASDTDGDGFSDELETAVSSDPNAFSSTPDGATGPATSLFINNVGIRLDFANAESDKLSLKGSLLVAGSPTLADFAGKRVIVNVGGVIRLFVLDAKGQAVSSAESFGFDSAPANNSVPFTMLLSSGNFAARFSDEGFTNTSASQVNAIVEVEVVFNQKLYKASRQDFYNATAGKFGEFGDLLSGGGGGSSGPTPKAEISEFFATPSPAVAGQPVTFSGTVKLSGGEPSGSVDFGDGTTEPVTGTSVGDALKGSISHTYASEGAYEVKLTVSSDTVSATTSLFLIVGKSTQVNPVTSMWSTGKVDSTGNASLQLNISKVPGATTASTSFSDTLGRETIVEGLIPTKAFSTSGISIATSRALDGNGNEKAKVRRMLVVSARSVGDSAALDEPSSTVITAKKFQGKFAFNKSKDDKVDFEGEIDLPANFSKARAGGNKLTVALGNVVDSASVDEKGKATPQGSRIKKAKVTFPKEGSTKAKVSVSMSFNDMVSAGFDTEGISPTIREDEKKLKAISRTIQVGFVFDGVAYEMLAPVSFKLGKNAESGAFSKRK